MSSNGHDHTNNHNDAALATMTTTTTTMTTTNTDALLLESKLQGAAAMYRRERDEAFRTHQLAREKLLLIEDETAAATRTLQSMQDKVQQLQHELEKQQDLTDLQREIESLTQQVAFQHAEYLKMRDTHQGQVSKQRHDRVTRDNARAKLQAALGPRRARVAQLEKEMEHRDPEEEEEHSNHRRDVKVQIRRLRDEAVADDAYDQLLWRTGTWPRLLRDQVQVWDRRTHRATHDVSVLERTLHGYYRHLPQCYVEEEVVSAKTPASEIKKVEAPDTEVEADLSVLPPDAARTVGATADDPPTEP